MTVLFRPARDSIPAFEALQQEELGSELANDTQKDYCSINRQCNSYFTSIDSDQPIRLEPSRRCEFQAIARIDRNESDISFGDLFIYHMWNDPVGKLFAGHIWYEPDGYNVDPVALDDHLVAVIKERYTKCSDKGPDAIAAFITMIATGKLTADEARAIMDEVHRREAAEAENLMARISEDLEDEKVSDLIERLSECGSAGVDVLRKLLNPDQTCDENQENAVKLSSIGRGVALRMLGLLAARGEVSALEPYLDGLEFAADLWESDVLRLRTAFESGDGSNPELRERAKSMLRYEEVSYWDMAACRERKEDVSWYPGGEVGFKVGPLYLSDTRALGGNTRNLGAVSYELIGRFMNNIETITHDGNGEEIAQENTAAIGIQAGVGGLTVWTSTTDDQWMGTFGAGLVFEKYFKEGDFMDHVPGIRTYLGYTAPFTDKILSHGIQGEVQVDFSTGFTVGPVAQYFPEKNSWSLGMMFGFEFVDGLN